MIRLRLAVVALSLILLAMVAGTAPSFAEDKDVSAELEKLDLEDLLQVEMISPSERKQSLENIAGSYTILTEDDIKRSGAKTVPEALRTVPGIVVTRTDTDKWAIGVRGFSGTFNSKQLILVDNRPITSPYFHGVIWSSQNLPIQAVKRIEVIRGPWTSLWGSESFNGVINIITKSAAEMQGTQSVTTAGTEGISQFIRKGGHISENATMAVYAKGEYEPGKNYHIRGRTEKGSTDWITGSGGFRADWLNAYTDQFSLQGQIAGSTITENSPPGNPFSANKDKSDYNGYVQILWDRKTGARSGMQFRSSYTRSSITVTDMENMSNTIDSEFIYSNEQLDDHFLTFGIGGKYFWDQFNQGENVQVTNDSIYRLDFSAFAKDRITLIDEKLFLTIGLKLDYSGGSDLAPQPTARLLYMEDDEEYWLAYSYANRKPGFWLRDGNYRVRVREREYTMDFTDDLDNEKLNSFEAGYRKLFSETLKLDVSLYLNSYDQMVTFNFDDSTNTATPYSGLSGVSYGTEIALDWQPYSFLTLRPSVDISNQDFQDVPAGIPGFSPPLNSALYNIKLQALIDLAEDWELDLFTSYLNSMDSKDLSTGFGFDVRLAWQARQDLLLELIGNNLLTNVYQGNYSPSEPSCSVRLTWDF
ncbi:TonB-dependent receptor plug domain-containing protein [Maridesulfovibrio salexigens]|uniref:TonB-dependent receptor plug n=1 Tax=Maridesulfovibrio salexigens (strain ATCC 14822 / DSM 2638 / NCIMB 8403 / VKM B-1763) TaxID=526222 RepID=C6BZU4_MARSD|nr:TonB-dependent receptor plug domain-containing protein [Maridesulfovibrio salexigens]ACS79001.1 TonB-dependent receptor plug [Maridesulfovibrio salexigens DSM 2638]